MIASGTTIERIVRGWRSRRASETGATSDSSMSGTGSRVSGHRAPEGVVERGGGLHGVGPYRARAAVRHRTKVLPVACVAHGAAPAGAPARPMAGRGRSRACALDDLGDRREEPREVGRPAGHELTAGEGREQAIGRGRVAVERGVGDADLDERVGVGDGDDRLGVLGGERDGLLVAVADQPGVVALDPVHERRDLGEPSRSRDSDPRNVSNGCGIPTRPPCARAAAIVSTGDRPGGMASLEEEADEVAIGGLDLLADDDRQPVGRGACASRAPSIRSWSVMARWVRPRCGRQRGRRRRAWTGNRSWRACGSAGR